MNKSISDYTIIGKAATLISLMLIVLGIFCSSGNLRILLCCIYLSIGLDYISLQYFTKKDYWNKAMGNRIHKPSRNMFALFFVATMLALCILTLNVVSRYISTALLSLALLGDVVSCVFNEYGIDSPRKITSLVACIFACIGIILLDLLLLGLI